jgi:MFS family permease
LPSLWRHRDFKLLWGGQAISRLGSQVSILALPLVAIGPLHATTLEVGLLTASETLPFLLVGLPAGALVDRVRRRRVLVAGDAGRCVILATVPLAWAVHSLTLAQLFAVALSSGVLTVFFDVAYQSYLPTLVDREQVVDGNAKLATTESIAQVAGPTIAGVLVDAVGGATAVLADATSFAFSAATLVAIRAPEARPSPTTTRIRADIKEGLQFVFRERHIRSITACTASSNLFGGIVNGVFVVFMARTLHLSPARIGAVFALAGIGAVAGAAAAAWLGRTMGLGRTILWAIVIGNGGSLLLPAAQRHHALPLLFTGMAIAGAGSVVYNVNQVSLRQVLCPPRLLGRMNASVRFLVWGTLPLGGALGGVLGTVLGVRNAMWIGCVGEALSFVWILASPVPRIRTAADAAPVATGPHSPT